MIKSKIFILKAESYSRKHLDLFSLQLSSVFLMYCLVSSKIFHCRLSKPRIVFFFPLMNDCQIRGLGVSAYFTVSCKGLALKWLIFNLVKFLGSFKYGKIVPFFLTIFYSYLKAPLQEEDAFSNWQDLPHELQKMASLLWKLQLSLYLGLPPHTEEDHLVNRRDILHTRCFSLWKMLLPCVPVRLNCEVTEARPFIVNIQGTLTFMTKP